MKTLGPDDEALHAPGADPDWNESFYANFFDGGGRLGGVMRVGLSPGKRTADGALGLMLPDGRAALVLHTEGRTGHEGAMATGSVGFEPIEPGRSWRLRHRGDLFVTDPGDHSPVGYRPRPRTAVELDLRFDGTHAPLDFHPLAPSRWPEAAVDELRRSPSRAIARLTRLPFELANAARLRGARHYEQSGRVRGTVVVDGVRHDFDGTGHRDHSWGVRDWRLFRRYRWLSGAFADGLAFSVTRIDILGYAFAGGYVARGEALVRVARWTLDADAPTVRATIHTDDGETLVLDGDVVASFPIAVHDLGVSTVVTTGMTRFRCAGRTGWGDTEALEQVI